MTLHNIQPIYNENSRILILGSFPSVRSRGDGFFYAHPQNRFWRVLAALYNVKVPKCIDEKRELLLDNGIALWDVIASCEIDGSSDSTISDVVPNDLLPILNSAPIEKIFVNGKAAQKYYNMYTKKKTELDAVYLPSTSPANAAWDLDKLIEAWCVIKKF